jgi:hypothetical protein
LIYYTASEKVRNFGMTIQLQQFGAEGQMSTADNGSTMLLTMLSKLVVALVMGVVATVVFLIN